MTDPTLTPLAADVTTDLQLGAQAVALLKAKDYAGLVKLGEANISTVTQEIADVKAALPAIKTGYKTTEFWATMGVPLVNGIALIVTKKPLPVDLNVVMAGLVAVYTVVRGFTKSTVAPTVTTVAAPANVTTTTTK